MELTNSKRLLFAANHNQVRLTDGEQRELADRPGRAFEKLMFVRLLRPVQDDAPLVEGWIGAATDEPEREHMRKLFDLVYRMTAGADDGHVTFAEAAGAVPPAALARYADEIVARRAGAWVYTAAAAFRERMRIAPVGRLHLERIEMYPAGIEKGELVFTVPLAPKETVTISHKEWSNTSETYESIVSDYFEGYSERGVAEKSDASMSAENESRRVSAFSFAASVSGGYGPVSTTVSTGITSSAESRQSVLESAQHSKELTEKASARSRKEHKLTVKLENTRGSEDSSYRTITNPHADKALRIDYYRLMRKWRSDLYRYDVRLTYDILVPNPGARLWAEHTRLAQLEAHAATPFTFGLRPSDVTEANYPTHADHWQVAVEPPPPETIAVTAPAREVRHDRGEIFEFTAPDGYDLEADARGAVAYTGPSTPPGLSLSENFTVSSDHAGSLTVVTEASGGPDRRSILMFRDGGTQYQVMATWTVGAKRRPQTFEAWRLKTWTALRDAAYAKHETEVAQVQALRDRLWRQLTGKDTLTLRRMEREELMRETLHWLLGPDFEPTPDEVGLVMEKLVNRELNDLPDGVIELPKPTPQWPRPVPTEQFRHLTDAEWNAAAAFGDQVKFFHHAIEWENLLYFLYPYFWGSDDLAHEKLLFDHADPAHRDFLRAGYARVVVPVRPGYEELFTELVDTGKLAEPGDSPYLPIAQEIQQFARVNYTGIPPANPEQHARPLLYPQQRQTWATMQTVVTELENYHAAKGSYPDDLGVLPGGPFQDAWGRDLVYRLPGSGNDYDLLSYGADGQPGGEETYADVSAAAGASLVATWHSYTPTSGVDIELDAKLDQVS